MEKKKKGSYLLIPYGYYWHNKCIYNGSATFKCQRCRLRLDR